MKSRKTLAVIAAAAISLLALLFPSRQFVAAEPTKLTVAIAPYQDLAMLAVAPEKRFDADAGLRISLVTMPWEDILPAVASARDTVDVGFGSYVEYLTKYARLNSGTSDPVVFVQPLYVYKGGGFIALSPAIAPFGPDELMNAAAMSRLKGYKIGAQKQSLYDMMLYSIARGASIDPKALSVFDTPMNDGLLALQNGSLDLASAGLTQLTEVRKRGGRLVISMEDAGFADVVGFIARKSTLETKRASLEALARVWFRSVDFVYADMQNNSAISLEYLRKTAATRYTFEEYAQALDQEYLPRNLDELQRNVLTGGSKYDFRRIGDSINGYLMSNGLSRQPAPIPTPLLGKL